VNDIKFLATSETALIFKYVLAGTVHFDVGGWLCRQCNAIEGSQDGEVTI